MFSVGTAGPKAPISGLPLNGLIGWFKADTGIFTDTGRTTAATNGQSVRGWKDLSPAANNLTTNAGMVYHSTGGPNSQPYLACSGSYFTFDSNRDLTAMEMFVVANLTGTDLKLLCHNTSPQTYTYVGATVLRLQAVDAATNLVGSFVVFTGTGTAVNNIFNTNFDATALFASINNGTPATTVVANDHFIFDKIAEDSAQPGVYNLNGKICEVVIYNRKLKTAERSQVWTYLGTKYAISV